MRAFASGPLEFGVVSVGSENWGGQRAVARLLLAESACLRRCGVPVIVRNTVRPDLDNKRREINGTRGAHGGLTQTYTPPKAITPHAILANDCAEFGIYAGFESVLFCTS